MEFFEKAVGVSLVATAQADSAKLELGASSGVLQSQQNQSMQPCPALLR